MKRRSVIIVACGALAGFIVGRALTARHDAPAHQPLVDAAAAAGTQRALPRPIPSTLATPRATPPPRHALPAIAEQTLENAIARGTWTDDDATTLRALTLTPDQRREAAVRVMQAINTQRVHATVTAALF